MGIQGLLPLLKSIMVPIHIKDLEGCSVAVDTYSWLHKGALSCSKELCTGQPTTKHIAYCMHRVNMLRHHGIKPILVFDGGHLPMKGEQENKRARSRKENFERALEHESGGNRSAAYECYSKAVDITPSIAYDLIQVLKQENVAYVVAPYEADAQMTFLAVNKLVDAVITEDSDLIPFGCPRIIYKMDKFGQGVEFHSSLLQQNKDLNLTGFTKQMFLEMCILSGCDYLQSLPGMGLKKAHGLVKKFKSYDKVIKHLKYSNIAVPPLYEEFFRKALLTFQHQRVYDPIKADIVHLSDISYNDGEDIDFLGPSISQHIAKGIATGELDPFTKLPFQGKCVTTVSVLDGTGQPYNTKPEGERKKIDLPVQKNLLTNYFCFASLEAKRKFRVPRVTSNNPEMSIKVNTSEDNNETALSYNMDCSRPALAYSGELENSDPTKDSVLNDVAPNSSLSSELAHGTNGKEVDLGSPQSPFLDQPRHSSIYPCMVVNKEQQQHMESDTVMGKTRIEQKKVIVRSSYFQKKSAKGNGLENKDGELLLKDSYSAARSVSSIHKYEYKSTFDRTENEPIFEQGHMKSDTVMNKMRVEPKNVIVRSSYFQKNSAKGNGLENKSGEMFVKDSNHTARSVSTIQECQFKSALDRSEGETTLEDRDTILQSPIKSVITADRENTNETMLIDVAASDSQATATPVHEFKSAKDAALCKTGAESRKVVVRSSYFKHKAEKENDTIHDAGNKHYTGTNSKRKLDDNVQIDITTRKCLRANESSPIQSTCTLDPEDSMETKNEQDKFGCNISHIDRYSDIAGKSVDKFAALISSFRYTAGSRPSGLRAPLKDVRNTCTNSGMNDAADLNKFAYVPTKRKELSASPHSPVKDVPNTCTKRGLSDAADLSKFAYVPTKRKTLSAPPRSPLKDARNTCTNIKTKDVADLSKFAYVPTKRLTLSASRSRR
ncbi:exonuclease 1 isoform X2 [Daucus carota subsp. sativus]|uniref:exonuclease 1 isoform X2 n=1 Tax=Daucus carota subsp. sativus TaxID=79200 RepID=UPI0007EF31C8|nr:PREDICTED: exonuclease 1 isoform X2 [Daucus carota subsp. sativus]